MLTDPTGWSHARGNALGLWQRFAPTSPWQATGRVWACGAME